MSQYVNGTVSVINGSAVVTGTSTLFLANMSVGDVFTVKGDGVWYEIGSVDTDLQITLTSSYAGTTNALAVYAVSTSFTPDKWSLPYPEPGDLFSSSLVKRAMLMMGQYLSQIESARGSVEDDNLATPPASPTVGDRYIVPAVPTGAWVGSTDKVAEYTDNGWAYWTPTEGWRVWVKDLDVIKTYNGTAWV